MTVMFSEQLAVELAFLIRYVTQDAAEEPKMTRGLRSMSGCSREKLLEIKVQAKEMSREEEGNTTPNTITTVLPAKVRRKRRWRWRRGFSQASITLFTVNTARSFSLLLNAKLPAANSMKSSRWTFHRLYHHFFLHLCSEWWDIHHLYWTWRFRLKESLQTDFFLFLSLLLTLYLQPRLSTLSLLSRLPSSPSFCLCLCAIGGLSVASTEFRPPWGQWPWHGTNQCHTHTLHA